MARFIKDVGGNIAVAAALLMPVVLCAAGGGIDFFRWSNQNVQLKSLADALATRGAREFLLANATAGQIENVIDAAVANGFGETYSRNDFDMSVSVDMAEKEVTVSITQAPEEGLILTRFEPYKNDVSVRSTAVAKGGMNVCVVALDEGADGAVLGELNAKMNADKCSILSNSTAAAGVKATGATRLNASLICSAGGYAGFAANYNPLPMTDCPRYADPLSERQPPSVGPCDDYDVMLGDSDIDTKLIAAANDTAATLTSATIGMGGPVIDDYKTYTLKPGVYCGGLRIGSNADVKLEPGTYVIKNGPLLVGMGGRLTGENVSFYLMGDDATFTFGPKSKISLTAQKDGPLSGILFFEDRNAPANRVHRILSSDARTLLGTFYLPRGVLSVASVLPVADHSAYTVIVAKRIRLTGNPTLVLNADYGATDIAPPEGVGPLAGMTYLRE